MLLSFIGSVCLSLQASIQRPDVTVGFVHENLLRPIPNLVGERWRLAKFSGVITVFEIDDDGVVVPNRVAEDHHFEVVARNR